jgi:hypothetical protein
MRLMWWLTEDKGSGYTISLGGLLQIPISTQQWRDLRTQRTRAKKHLANHWLPFKVRGRSMRFSIPGY